METNLKMIKALSELKPETTKLKPETPKPKPETPKIRVKTNKKKLRKLRKELDELRHKFSKKDIGRYRKAFYTAKNKKYLFQSELKKTIKNLNELEKQKMQLIKFLIHFYKDFKNHKKHQMKEEANLFLTLLNYYVIIFKE